MAYAVAVREHFQHELEGLRGAGLFKEERYIHAPQGAEIAAACAAHGIAYVAIPVTHSGFSHAQIDALAAAIAASDGPILAYRRWAAQFYSSPGDG